MKSWEEIFSIKYKPYLNVQPPKKYRNILRPIYQRLDGFDIIFEELLKIKQNNFSIIETGSTRKPGNWKDGNSGVIFAEFVLYHSGFVHSVDIDPNAVLSANESIDSKYHLATCDDSVNFLKNFKNKDNVDLFYLDSYDVVWDNDIPSAEHHLNEFKVIEPYLNNTIVAIDDNTVWLDSNKRSGKGRLVYEYLADKNKFPIYDNYQIVYRF